MILYLFTYAVCLLSSVCLFCHLFPPSVVVFIIPFVFFFISFFHLFLSFFILFPVFILFFFRFSSRRWHTRCALLTGVQTCALPISSHDNEHCAEHRGSTAVLAGRGPGQPKYVIPEEHVPKVLEACRKGASEVSIARALHINYRTWCRVRTEDERVAAALAESRKLEEDELVTLMMAKASAGDTTSIIFALKGRHGYRDQGEIGRAPV